MQRSGFANWRWGNKRALRQWAGGLALALLFATTPSRAVTSLEYARQAQEMLGSERWSQVLRIENRNHAGAYPREVFALVFELGGLLWFYTDCDGTQSLSLRQNEIRREKGDLLRLLQAIDPGFFRYEIEPSAGGKVGGAARSPLAHGCLIESYAQLREWVAAGEHIANARLLSLYYHDRGQRVGHTVLTYETPAGTYVFDPLRPAFKRRVPAKLTADARVVAQTLRLPFLIVDARWVPTPMPSPTRVALREPEIASGARRTPCGS